MNIKTRRRPKILIIDGCDVGKRIDLMRALIEEFDVAAAGSDRGATHAFAKARIPYTYFPLKRAITPLADIRSTGSLYCLFRRQRPDIVHTFGTKPCVWGRVGARFAHVPIVIGTLPGLGSLYSSNGMRSAVTRQIYARLQATACSLSDLTIFQNECDARELMAAGIVSPEQSTVIAGSGVRTDVFDPAKVSKGLVASFRGEVGASPSTVVVTMVSRLIRTKGVLEYAEAASLVQAKLDNVKFVLVGPNDQMSVDRLSADELRRVEACVAWTGSKKDIRTVLAATDIFVFPSYYREGIPRALMEAASMGLPLVASDSPGCRDVVRDGVNGILVQTRNAPALTEAIVRLARDPALRKAVGVAARQMAVRRFDLSLIVDQTARLYRHFLANLLNWDLSAHVGGGGLRGREWPG